MRVRSMLLGLCVPLASIACDYDTYVPSDGNLSYFLPPLKDVPHRSIGVEASSDRDYRSFLVIGDDSESTRPIASALSERLVAAGWKVASDDSQVLTGNTDQWDGITVCILPGDTVTAAITFEPQASLGSPTRKYRRNAQAALDKHLAQSTAQENP